MIWISEFFFCVGTMSLTGGIASLLFMFFRRVLVRAKEGVALHVLKVNVLLYLLPVVYLFIRGKRINPNEGFLANVGRFGTAMWPEYVQFFELVGMIWFVGLVVGILLCVYQQIGLRAVLRMNIPVFDPRWEKILAEECARYQLKHVTVYQNENLFTPIVTNIRRPMIVIPLMDVTEAEMHMIIEHEVHHIYKGDLLWKRIGLWMSWLHWFNPLVHFLQDCLEMEQEIGCDLFVCENTVHYKAKEYYGFMLSVVEKKNAIFTSALFDTRKNMIRRIETMKVRRTRGKAGKKLLLACTMVLVMVSSIPAYAMAESLVTLEEDYLQATEVMLTDSNAQGNAAGEVYFVNDGSVEEIEVVSGVDTYSSLVVIDLTARALTRYSFKLQSMEVGDEVAISVQCSDPDALFWIGILNVYKNEGRYVQGTNILQHTFTITEAGTYRVFVENRSDSEVDFLGSAIYPN